MISGPFRAPVVVGHQDLPLIHTTESPPIQMGSPATSKILGERKMVLRKTPRSEKENPQSSKLRTPQGTADAQPISLAPQRAKTIKRVSRLSDRLRRLENGNRFNAERASAYSCSELYVEKPEGETGYFRVDSYSPKRKLIVSRKASQLAAIPFPTACSYIDEIPNKYPVDAVIANVPSSGSLAGKRLRGKYILEVPVQRAPIPRPVLLYAEEVGVSIQDVTGRRHG